MPYEGLHSSGLPRYSLIALFLTWESWLQDECRDWYFSDVVSPAVPRNACWLSWRRFNLLHKIITCILSLWSSTCQVSVGCVLSVRYSTKRFWKFKKNSTILLCLWSKLTRLWGLARLSDSRAASQCVRSSSRWDCSRYVSSNEPQDQPTNIMMSITVFLCHNGSFISTLSVMGAAVLSPHRPVSFRTSEKL